MYCPKCGNKVADNASFCSKCGNKLKLIQTDTNSNPNIDDNQKENKNKEDAIGNNKENKNHKNSKSVKRKHSLKTFIIIILVLLLCFGTVVVLAYFDVIDVPFVSDFLEGTGRRTSSVLGSVPEKPEYSFEAPNAEDYYQENGKIVNKYNAKKSAEVHTEIETQSNLSARGFDTSDFFAPFSMSGEYKGNGIQDHQSPTDTAHPMYQVVYISPAGEIWNVYEINGHIQAYSVSYMVTNKSEREVFVTEGDTVWGYDASTNTFYETIPNSSAAIQIKVGRIDADTLNSLDSKEIAKYAN